MIDLVKKENLTAALAGVLPFVPDDFRDSEFVVHVSNVEQTDVRSNFVLSDGESLVIAGPESFRPENYRQQKQTRLHLITPTKIAKDLSRFMKK